MNNKYVFLISEIWSSLVEDAFSQEKLIGRILIDGGHDMSDLSREDLGALFEGQFSGDWHEPAFAFNELLSFYAARGKEINSQQIAGWVWASFIISDAIKHGATQWENQFNSFLKGFVSISERLEIDQSVQILQRVFCKGEKSH
jgi:hypothetical protein